MPETNENKIDLSFIVSGLSVSSCLQQPEAKQTSYLLPSWFCKLFPTCKTLTMSTWMCSLAAVCHYWHTMGFLFYSLRQYPMNVTMSTDSSELIKEYIFSGACVPSLSRIISAIASKSRLRVEHLEDIGIHTIKHRDVGEEISWKTRAKFKL